LNKEDKTCSGVGHSSQARERFFAGWVSLVLGEVEERLPGTGGGDVGGVDDTAAEESTFPFGWGAGVTNEESASFDTRGTAFVLPAEKLKRGFAVVDPVTGSFAFSLGSEGCEKAEGATVPGPEDEIDVLGVRDAKGLLNAVDDCSGVLLVANIEAGTEVDVATGVSA
jgi:hypothetical protein